MICCAIDRLVGVDVTFEADDVTWVIPDFSNLLVDFGDSDDVMADVVLGGLLLLLLVGSIVALVVCCCCCGCWERLGLACFAAELLLLLPFRRVIKRMSATRVGLRDVTTCVACLRHTHLRLRSRLWSRGCRKTSEC